jgi:gliding motility-associated protein GldM
MINLMYLVLTALLALNVSSEILNAFKVVDKSLMVSNENINTANKTLYTSLDEKLKDPVTSEKAKPWHERANKAKSLSVELSTYIDSLKIRLKREADLQMVKNEESGMEEEKFKEDDLEAATRLFGNGEGGGNQGEEFKKRLIEYRKAMLAIDPSIAKEFATTFPVDDPSQVKVKAKNGKEMEVDFTNAYFHMTPTVAALTLLSKFQNNVKNAENAVVTYCHNQVGAVKVVYDEFTALVGQTSNYLMPGEEMEITAGVGAYSKAAKPEISIGGSSLPLGVDGRAAKKFNVSGSGQQSQKVLVTYTKPDGTKERKEFDVKYTVGTPGVAAVSPDKMNVLYYGIDNPITIGSPVGWDKTSISMTGGTISGSGPSRTIRTSTATGKAIVKVTTDKGSKDFEFRCFPIPPPKFKVADGKVRMPAVIFKSQTACRADLENFYFDLRYTVVSATVYFSGANFPSVKIGNLTGSSLEGLKNYISQCGPGSVITFDNIKVSGPDGTRPIDAVSIALY